MSWKQKRCCYGCSTQHGMQRVWVAREFFWCSSGRARGLRFNVWMWGLVCGLLPCAVCWTIRSYHIQAYESDTTSPTAWLGCMKISNSNFFSLVQRAKCLEYWTGPVGSHLNLFIENIVQWQPQLFTTIFRYFFKMTLELSSKYRTEIPLSFVGAHHGSGTLKGSWDALRSGRTHGLNSFTNYEPFSYIWSPSCCEENLFLPNLIITHRTFYIWDGSVFLNSALSWVFPELNAKCHMSILNL